MYRSNLVYTITDNNGIGQQATIKCKEGHEFAGDPIAVSTTEPSTTTTTTTTTTEYSDSTTSGGTSVQSSATITTIASSATSIFSHNYLWKLLSGFSKTAFKVCFASSHLNQ